jgi:hypothetical protein
MLDVPQDLTEAFRDAEQQRQARIATNANNGRAGWWRVVGARHSAIARASSAGEAVDKAMKAGLIGDWEDPEADFWTEELPDVFS